MLIYLGECTAMCWPPRTPLPPAKAGMGRQVSCAALALHPQQHLQSQQTGWKASVLFTGARTCVAMYSFYRAVVVIETWKSYLFSHKM